MGAVNCGVLAVSSSPGPAQATGKVTGWYLAILVLYLVGHLIVRLCMAWTLQHDEAEQLVWSQSLEWGYNDQPPLYTWIVWFFERLLGTTVFTLALVKAIIHGAIYWFLFLIARIVLNDVRQAALAASSLVLMPLPMWEFHRDLTHSCLLCALCLMACHQLLRLLEHGRTVDYILLGVLCGAGLLSKYNFIHFAGALGLAALTVAPLRQRLQDPRTLLALAVAIVIVLPHGMWAAAHFDIIVTPLAEKANLARPASLADCVVSGSLQLIYNTFLCLTPGWILLVLLLPQCIRRQQDPRTPQHPAAALVQRFFGAITLLLLIQIALLRTTTFRLHWLEPFVLLFPVAFFARLGSQPPTAWQVKKLLGWQACVVLAVFAVRLGQVWLGLEDDKYGKRDRLFREQMAQLEAARFRSGTIVASNHVVAGNLRLKYPEIPIACCQYSAYWPPDHKFDPPLLIIWDATQVGVRLPPGLVHYCRQRFGLTIPTDGIHWVGEPPGRPHKYMNRLGYVVLESPELAQRR